MDKRNFIIDQRKLSDAVIAFEEFMKSVQNDDGTPVPIPAYVTRDYIVELFASVITKLRYYGQQIARFEGVELEHHTLVSEEGSPFKKAN